LDLPREREHDRDPRGARLPVGCLRIDRRFGRERLCQAAPHTVQCPRDDPRI
jgi:hypothetical protein